MITTSEADPSRFRSPVRWIARNWRSGSVVAAGAWSAVAVVVGALWAGDVVPAPFGRNDPRAADVMSYFAGIEPWTAGLGAIVVGVAGLLTAAGMIMLRGRRWPAIPGLVLAAGLLLVVPDARVIQNFAYLFFGYTGLWDAGLAAMIVSIAGGVLWAAASFGRLGAARPGSLGWRVPVTYLAAALALPYGIVRGAWGLGIPLGTSSLAWIERDAAAFGIDPWVIRAGLLAVFAGLPVGGALLTTGLVRPWGERLPSWLPGLGGRRVPIWLAVVPGAGAAIMILQFGLRTTPGTIAAVATMTPENWGATAPGLFILPWGIALALAVYGYAARRLGHAIELERRPETGRLTSR
ncbi:hypothetical protein [Microlunatus parietis]|uniref:Uncharacterized protein n=1 Tax=Microlunatus parietis TaxID=682979 RepID=A0A7Y9IDF2_9ACTN|nr:hypothetical protein [Microlunatus parietis]NYE74739.1 hypothetical protein [Microlunatus parietis]